MVDHDGAWTQGKCKYFNTCGYLYENSPIVNILHLKVFCICRFYKKKEKRKNDND